MAHLSLGVLGSLQVLIDDTPVTTLESDKVCALLVYLAVEADLPHRRESLVGLLWPDYPEQAARHNLRQALFNLRLAIGDRTAKPPYLLISRDTIQFNRSSDFSLDFDQFNTIFHTREKDRGQGIEDPSIRAARLEEMVKLYRGEFLQDFFLDDSAEFEDWALIQRESLHQHILKACSDLANYYELHGDFPAARRHALRQLELDPWREEAYCQMMRTLALDGQRSAALAQYETCRRVLTEELGVEPSANTRELVEQIRAGTLKTKGESPSSIPTAPIHNLPVSLTSFLGRDQELIDLDRLITNTECRCISLVGPGGIGKTRLALQTGEQHRADFPHGVIFIPLAPVGSIETAIPTIASAIHLNFYGPNDPKVQLLKTLSEKQMLLILDNVEHLLKEEPLQANIVELVLEILQSAPGVKLLITSREVLNLQGEWVFEVGGLAFPKAEQKERLEDYTSVALFIQRARRASPGFAFTQADLAEIAHICRLVEGMPLAIELAATWVRILSCLEVKQEIERGIEYLAASVRDLPERHRSMQAVFDHSWKLLSEEEQQVLSKLSVFRGGFTRDTGEKVAGATLPLMSALVAKSLVQRSVEKRYRLHELVRQHAFAKLQAAGEVEQTRKAHLRVYISLAEAVEPHLTEGNPSRWLAYLETEHDNFRVALKWACDSGDSESSLRLSGALWRFWYLHSHFGEGSQWLEQVLQIAGSEAPVTLRAKVLNGAGYLAFHQNHFDQSVRWIEECLTMQSQLSERELAYAQATLAMSIQEQSDFVQAQTLYEEASERFRRLNDEYGLLRTLNNYGTLAYDTGDLDTANRLFGEVLVLARKRNDKDHVATALTNLGWSAVIQSDTKAIELFREAIMIFHELGNKLALAFCLEGVASGIALQGQPDLAVRLFAVANTLRKSISALPSGANARYLEAMLQPARDSLSEAAFVSAWAEGEALPLGQAIDVVIDFKINS